MEGTAYMPRCAACITYWATTLKLLYATGRTEGCSHHAWNDTAVPVRGVLSTASLQKISPIVSKLTLNWEELGVYQNILQQ